jgi:preprotein translocase SecE subunit
VARDRQRSKARQRARAAGSEPRGKRSRARDIGLDDPNVDEAGLLDDAPAPDPLKNALPDVDQAKAAETGADHELRGIIGESPHIEYDPDAEPFEHGEDEVEIPRDLVGGGGRRGGAGLETTEGHPPEPRNRGRVITFLQACIDELRRVQWPDRKHVFQATAVVLGFCLIAGGYLGLMDAIWQPLINAIL